MKFFICSCMLYLGVFGVIFFPSASRHSSPLPVGWHQQRCNKCRVIFSWFFLPDSLPNKFPQPVQTSCAFVPSLDGRDSHLPKGQKVVLSHGLWPPMLVGAWMAVRNPCSFPGMGWVAWTPCVGRSGTDRQTLRVCVLIADLHCLWGLRNNGGTGKLRPSGRLLFDWLADEGLFPSGNFYSYNLF